MGKKTREKKGGKRITRPQLAEKLEAFFSSHPGQTVSFKDVFRQLRLDTHPMKMLAIDIMEEMAWDDYLVKVTDSSYRLADNTQVMEGVFQAKPNGRNSIIPDGGEHPVFVAERNSLSALTGDRVRFCMLARKRSHIREAQVIEIIERRKDQFVGKLKVEADLAFLVPQEPLAMNIIIPKSKLKGGKNNQRTVVKVVAWPDAEHRSILAEVVDILGEMGENNAEMNAILAQYGLPYKYPQAVEDAANKISDEITQEEIARREDFRDVFTCTIDPHDAKDFDDALSIRKISGNDTGNLYEVGVHIADVSHYVTEGSIIDKEAQKRATSIYLVDRTIPMLPERLCNYICSLRPDEEKLAYSVIFEMNDEAEIKNSRIVHTVIKSNRRFCYEEVQEILEKNGVKDGTGEPAPKKKEYEGEYAKELITLDALAKKLRARRFKNGSVKFDREEMRFDIDEKGKPTRVYFKRSKDANKLIEEFMLIANKTVAESVGKVPKGKKAKTLPYRVHDNPDPIKMEQLKQFVVRFGYKMKSTSTKGATARALNSLMDAFEGRAESNAVQLVALKAMMKAKYSTHNIGHFGLAFDYYTHFTSPIRRYPDTMVHRLLTRYAEGGKSANRDYYEELCEHSSQMEQVAANAERDSIKYKMVEYMAEHLGEEYDAHVSGITSYGIYAEIDENHCEGMIPIRDLKDDYYEFDEKNFCLVGRRHHNRYQLGDEVRIKVAKANLEKKQLDFTIVE
ncbi:MAG: ribonuclease R [Prevotella sp.]|nr:ribonuclease R [Prevotella sp.]MBQ9561584.1 ribonuclease R [Prevotella sp.]